MSNRVLIPLDLAEPLPLQSGMPEIYLSGSTMGTTWSVHVLAPLAVSRQTIEQGIQAQLDLVIHQMSTWESDSDVSRFNHAPAGSWHALPDAFFTVLDAALTMARDSDGAFDPTIGPLVNLWGFGPQQGGADTVAACPNAVAMPFAQKRCNWRQISLDHQQRRLLQPGGVYLDFSGIAKGYAVDLVARYLFALGCPSYLVEIGGELSGFGVKPDGQPWWVTLERPPSEQGAKSIVTALHGLAVATSGDYRRYFDYAGQRYAHTIDTRTGEPVSHGMVSVTVLHAQCMVADALATVLMVLGEKKGMAFAQERNIPALFIHSHDGIFSESMSPAFAEMLH
ncbi:FAD:protein FMN transferase [Glaciimonas sp. PCH181]|uniref:FAD:protein FMN transferase n=1 Tax=Glaciimonas sp. PCH181 TaxID=2133943 RepID=UPI000D3C2595|nr:FAD:protein FMN transferase [Glaciimonas sp. PCH181]PUA19838.1 thiamine biosynthesis protein ApbE [Glaciimonas sp. PCH181]